MIVSMNTLHECALKGMLLQGNLFNNVLSRLQMHELRKSPVAKCFTPGDANLTDEQIAKLPFALYRQGYEYYWKTHAHPNIFRSVRDIVPSKRWLL